MRNPNSFSEIVGHTSAVAGLQAIVRKPDEITGALLHGPDGVGKRSLARLFAKALQCERPTTVGDSCGLCRSCQQYAGQEQLDHVVLSINEEKALARFEYVMKLISHEAWTKRRVITLLDADQMPARTLDRFLSVLERQRSAMSMALTFVLVAEDLSRVRSAVVSRCALFQLRPLAQEHVDQLLTRWLMDVGARPDGDCTALLVSFGRGLPNRLASACLSLAALSSPTLADARAALGLDWARSTASHCHALLQAWPRTSKIVLDGEDGRSGELQGRLRACLTHVYIHGLKQRPAVPSIAEPAFLHRADIIDPLSQAFSQCAFRNGLSAEELWYQLTCSLLAGDIGGPRQSNPR